MDAGTIDGIESRLMLLSDPTTSYATQQILLNELEQLKVSKGSWRVALACITHSSSRLQFFAASVLEFQIRLRWTSESGSDVVGSILKVIAEQALPDFVFNKLAQIIGIACCHNEDDVSYGSLLAQLFAAMSQLEFVPRILKVLCSIVEELGVAIGSTAGEVRMHSLYLQLYIKCMRDLEQPLHIAV